MRVEASSLKGRYFMCQEPLEEVMASVDFPVYGLTEEVFGLRYSRYHSSQSILSDRQISLEYQSDRNFPFLHENSYKNLTFNVTSSRYRPGVTSVGYTLWKYAGVPEQDCSRLFAFYGSLTIDGEQFMGNITSYPAPILDPGYVFVNGQACLTGKAYGLHPDELIQVLQSLPVLNSKAVE
jgi:hypothetical protein